MRAYTNTHKNVHLHGPRNHIHMVPTPHAYNKNSPDVDAKVFLHSTMANDPFSDFLKKRLDSCPGVADSVRISAKAHR